MPPDAVMPRAEAEQQSSSQTRRLMPLWALPTAVPPPPAPSTDPSPLVSTVDTTNIDTTTTTTDTSDTDVEVLDEDTFEALGVPIDGTLVWRRRGLGLTHCQSVAIPAILEGRNVLMQAPAGTGKTAAFASGDLARLLSKKSGDTMLVLSPTNDLACQTHGMLHRVAKATHSREALATHVSYGGKQSDTVDLNRAIRRSSRVAVCNTGSRVAAP
jgi:superfamily II DNA/RNA helicase